MGITQEAIDISGIQKNIFTIKGVSDCHFNYLTRKLTIIHDGSPETVQRINATLKDIARVPRDL